MDYLDFSSDNPVYNMIKGRVNAVDAVDNYKLKQSIDKSTEYQTNIISLN